MGPSIRITDELLRRHRLISEQVSPQDLTLILQELEAIQQREVPGDIVEFGCYIGTTSLFIRRLLDAYRSRQVFHVYDSFAGLPPKEPADASTAGEGFRAGELAIGKSQFIREFRHAGLQLPVIHRGWFEELTPDDVPQEIAFAFIDGDFYRSTLSALTLVWPRMSPGGTVLIDDYDREALPGVERAVRTFFRNKPPLERVAHNIAIIKS